MNAEVLVLLLVTPRNISSDAAHAYGADLKTQSVTTAMAPDSLAQLLTFGGLNAQVDTPSAVSGTLSWSASASGSTGGWRSSRSSLGSVLYRARHWWNRSTRGGKPWIRRATPSCESRRPARMGA